MCTSFILTMCASTIHHNSIGYQLHGVFFYAISEVDICLQLPFDNNEMSLFYFLSLASGFLSCTVAMNWSQRNATDFFLNIWQQFEKETRRTEVSLVMVAMMAVDEKWYICQWIGLLSPRKCNFISFWTTSHSANWCLHILSFDIN